jgi:hypothetical protein
MYFPYIDAKPRSEWKSGDEKIWWDANRQDANLRPYTLLLVTISFNFIA